MIVFFYHCPPLQYCSHLLPYTCVLKVSFWAAVLNFVARSWTTLGAWSTGRVPKKVRASRASKRDIVTVIVCTMDSTFTSANLLPLLDLLFCCADNLVEFFEV